MLTLVKQRKMGAEKGTGALSVLHCSIQDYILTAHRGRSGDEKQDYGYTFANARRRSNSSNQALAEFRTKFETVEPEPVFEEGVRGPSEVPVANESTVTKVESTSSNDSEFDREGIKY